MLKSLHTPPSGAFGETGSDRIVHIARVARTHVEQLDRIADRGGVILSKIVKPLWGGDSHRKQKPPMRNSELDDGATQPQASRPAGKFITCGILRENPYYSQPRTRHNCRGRVVLIPDFGENTKRY